VVFDEFDEFEGDEEPKRPVKIECKYCGHILDMKYEVWLNPNTGEYEYACLPCSKKFGKA